MALFTYGASELLVHVATYGDSQTIFAYDNSNKTRLKYNVNVSITKQHKIVWNIMSLCPIPKCATQWGMGQRHGWHFRLQNNKVLGVKNSKDSSFTFNYQSKNLPPSFIIVLKVFFIKETKILPINQILIRRVNLGIKVLLALTWFFPDSHLCFGWPC